ncbi:MAG: hypothetical protein ABIZ36_04285 [Gemmatimonadaceae bacterium]
MKPTKTQFPQEIPVSSNPLPLTFDSADTPAPKLALLGRLPYTVLVSNAGSGISKYGDIAINRWRVDGTRDNYGQWCYLRDVGSGNVWSAGHQPVCADTLWYEASLAGDVATFSRRDGEIETRTEITVPVGGAAEVRRVTVKNLSSEKKEIELTSYQEVVLASTNSDRGHRAFGNLFVQTEWLAEKRTLLAMRRPRSAIHQPVWCGHTIAVEKAVGAITVETDRSVFVGRGRSPRNPTVMDNPGELSGTVGAVLDPVLAIRARVAVPAGESASVVFTTFFAKDRDDALHLAERFKTTGTQVQPDAEVIRNSLVGVVDPDISQDLASRLIYGTNALGRTASRADLIAIGITGERPILLATLSSMAATESLADVVDLHRHWHLKGLDCDLVIVSNGSQALLDVVRDLPSSHRDDKTVYDAKGVFVLDKAGLTAKQIGALEAVARIQIDCDRQTLDDIVNV